MAAGRDLVINISDVSQGRLDVVGMNVEPKAIVDCFHHLYRRKNDANSPLFVTLAAPDAWPHRPRLAASLCPGDSHCR